MAKRNAPLVIFNPKRGGSTGGRVDRLNIIIRKIGLLRVHAVAAGEREWLAEAHHELINLRDSLQSGHAANPRGKRIAAHVQAIAYIHAKDGDAYVHGFGDHDPNEADLKDGWLNLGNLKTVTNVEAFYNADGSVTLRHAKGKKLVELFPD